MHLVIVESPAKARTITKFLGPNYTIRSSIGHIRDLPKSKLGVDLTKNFAPEYILSRAKTKVLTELKKFLQKAEQVILATDEDREGEAIAWHLAQVLQLDLKAKNRIIFHEITAEAIQQALLQPRCLNQNLIDAQQARRVLDRLVGYELSPLLWQKIRYGLSAGRVQSVAVRLIVEREREIAKFKPVEFWSLTAKLRTPRQAEFLAELVKIDGQKAKLENKISAEKAEREARSAEFRVTRLERKERKRHAPPPFTTSTLQMEASRKLGFSVKKTMLLAQKLYEGADFGEGLITYMRTDSLNLAVSAVSKIRTVIKQDFGGKFIPAQPNLFKTKAKKAQEAHEAIRPTEPNRRPESLANQLEPDLWKLYELIWQRSLACQMCAAVFDQTKVDLTAGRYLFRATGQIILFRGFLAVYTEGRDTPEESALDNEKLLPELHEDEVQELLALKAAQHFTKPPPRYTEATLVKNLESEGIGRPSTYAPILATIQQRGYVVKEARQLQPTDTAEVVNDFLVQHFPKIVDYPFTAHLEDQLDNIAQGKQKWVVLLQEFYKPFHALIEEKQSLDKQRIVSEATDQVCEKCGKKMVIKLGRFGKFLSCSGFPECKQARPLDAKQATELAECAKTLAGRTCPECHAPLAAKQGRFGVFVGCSAYPKCKFIEKQVKKIGVTCPTCGGALIEKFAPKRKKRFWGCEKYPACEFSSWFQPVRNCQCGGVLVLKKEALTCLQCSEVLPA